MVANYNAKDYPSPVVSYAFKAPGNCISIGVCLILYITTFFGVQFWLRFKNAHNREFVECHKKAWIFILNVIAIYCYNRVSVATTIILWFCTFAYCGSLAITVVTDLRVKYFKFVMSAALGLIWINWVVHFLTRSVTSLQTGMEGANK